MNQPYFSPPSGSFMVNGMRVFEDVSMTEDGIPYDVRKTWRERLLSWPWNPLKKFRRVVPQVPKKEAYVLSKKMMVMHPEMARQLREELMQQDFQHGCST